MKWWRIRKVANAATWQAIFFAIGLLAGVVLVAFLPGMPWSATVEPLGASPQEALDLAAQRSMASAAWFMVVITGASAIVGGAGLYLIFRTLKEAKRSADAADKAVEASLAAIETTREMGHAQVRAYVSISGCWLSRSENGQLTLKFVFRNSGQTPALNVWTSYDFYIGSHDENAVLRDQGGESRSDTAPEEKREANFDLSPTASAAVSERLNAGAAYVYVEISVVFDDVFRKAWDSSSKYYGYIRSNAPRDITLYRELDEY